MDETTRLLLSIAFGAALTFIVQEIRAALDDKRQVAREGREHARVKERQQEERIRLRNERRLDDTQRAFYAQVDYLVAYAIANEAMFADTVGRAHGYLHPQHDFELVGSDEAAIRFIDFVETTLSQGRQGGNATTIFRDAVAVNGAVVDALNHQTERVLRDQPIELLSPDVAKRLAEALVALQEPS